MIVREDRHLQENARSPQRGIEPLARLFDFGGIGTVNRPPQRGRQQRTTRHQP
jgi:hypothetical protein